MEDINNIDFKSIPEVIDYKEIKYIDDGINNHNYKLISNSRNYSDQIITIFPHRNTWWIVGKEIYINKIYADLNIPSAKILKVGYFIHSNNTYRYILRNYINQEDPHTFLHKNRTLTPGKLKLLLSDLGSILGVIHSTKIYNHYRLIKNNTIYGFVSGRKVQKLFEICLNFYNNKKNVLKSVNTPRLIYYDLSFKNIIVNFDKLSSILNISGIIDNE